MQSISALAAGFLLDMFTGCISIWGCIAPYVLSYFYHFGNDGKGQKDLSIIDAIFVVPIMMACVSVMSLLFLYYKEYNPKIFLTIGSAIAISGCYLSTKASTYNNFVCTFAIFVGSGIGLCFLPPVYCNFKWMPNNKGFVMGFVRSGLGFGSFLFGLMSMEICNPGNEEPSIITQNGSKFFSTEVASRVPEMLRFFATCWLFIAIMSVILINKPPAEEEQRSS
jgi:hypothetical protein